MIRSFFLFLSLHTWCVSQDVKVSCVFWETCVLPCPFTPGDDPVIHWTKEPEDIPVHNYYKNQHQLHLQHKNYRNRTSVSDQGISSGDASLQLHKVQVRDEGRYKCYISTIRPDNDKESFVNLKVYDNNVICIWKQTCTLPCPFQGEVQEASWKREDSLVPIIVKPPVQFYLHHDYRNISSMPGEGAALEIRGVELKHQGLHICSVISRTGKNDRLIYLNVHAPVLKVLVHQEGQKLICSSERIYPKPTVVWTLSSDSYQTQTSRTMTEDGLYTVYSSVRLRPNSAAQSLTCDVSTTYSSESATVTPPRDAAPDNHNLHHLWILSLILVAAGVCFLISRHRREISRSCITAHRPVKGVHHQPGEEPLNKCKMPLNDHDMASDTCKIPLEESEMNRLSDHDESGVNTERSVGSCSEVSVHINLLTPT